jgi:hypothetical protein
MKNTTKVEEIASFALTCVEEYEDEWAEDILNIASTVLCREHVSIKELKDLYGFAIKYKLI